ncbi:MAG: superfamily [Myxococcaceae bacterium]|nr:superfamily [Myxococcaceae bacterium]
MSRLLEQLNLPTIDLSVVPKEPPPERTRRVFCNRSLRLDQIEWVGFDMDYTLAIYDQAKMDQLTIDAALPKLIERGYPESLRTLDYDLTFPVRGLMVDAQLGNVLKMDRYKYVKRAYHGMRELSYDERRELYHSTRIRAKGSTRYYFIDTLYALSEVTLFAAGVTHMEALGLDVDYHEWFYAIRDAVDRSHQDDSILSAIRADPGRFVLRDPELARTLHTLRSAGKKLFLITNSRPEYTQQMMSYLLEGSIPECKRWQQLFDVVITTAKKPSFFVEEQRAFHDDRGPVTEPLVRDKIYEGGCASELARRAGIEGDRVLYIGDHIYGDVLRAKKHSPWRTAMIIQELEPELRAVSRTDQATTRWDTLEDARHDLLDELRNLNNLLKAPASKLLAAEPAPGQGEPRTAESLPAEDAARRARLKRQLDRARARLRALEAECTQLEQEIERAFHPYWGPLLKAGAEPTSFGHQVETYACLYTSRVSNFLGYSPHHYFRSPRERLPHEL